MHVVRPPAPPRSAAPAGSCGGRRAPPPPRRSSSPTSWRSGAAGAMRVVRAAPLPDDADDLTAVVDVEGAVAVVASGLSKVVKVPSSYRSPWVLPASSR